MLLTSKEELVEDAKVKDSQGHSNHETVELKIQRVSKINRITRNRQNAEVLEAYFASGLTRLVLWSSTSFTFLAETWE